MKTHFEILQQMSIDALDIAACTTMVRGDKSAMGGTITMGVPDPLLTKVLLEPNKYYLQLMIINADQYDAIKEGKGKI